MKILVCLKQILDPEISPRDFALDTNTLQAAPGSAGFVTNIFCENALETALQLRDVNSAEITALTFGPTDAEDVLRKALALKVDAAVHVVNPGIPHVGSSGAAVVLAAAIGKLGDFDLIMLGREAGDWGEGQTAGLLAEELSLPAVSFVDSVVPRDSGLLLTRQTEVGSEDIAATGSIVVSITNSDANVPRIPKTRDIMKAHRKELTSWSLEDIGLSAEAVASAAALTEVAELFIPEKDTTCEFVAGDTIEDRVSRFAERIVNVVRSV